MSKPTLFMLLAALSMMLPAIPALAKDTSRVISVETQDLSGGHMALKASHQEISAGEVTFVAKNLTDKGRDHEVLMIKTDLEPKDLPVTIDGMSIDEKKLEGIIELGDMKPGESKETKMVLEPGSYLMFCNMPGHTGSGMWSRLNVADASVSLNSTAEQAVSAPVRTSRDGDHAGATDVD